MRTIKFNSTGNFFAEALNGADYDSGALEAAQYTADNAAAALGRLTMILVEKGVLSLSDIPAILDQVGDVEFVMVDE